MQSIETYEPLETQCYCCALVWQKKIKIQWSSYKDRIIHTMRLGKNVMSSYCMRTVVCHDVKNSAPFEQSSPQSG